MITTIRNYAWRCTLLLVALWLEINQNGFAQSAVFEAAPAVPRTGEEYIAGTVHVDAKAAYLLKKRASTHIIQKLNLATLTVEREDIIQLTGNVMRPDRFDILEGLDVVQLDGDEETLYCFATGFEQDATQPQLYVQKRNLDGKILQNWTFVGAGDSKLGMAFHSSFSVNSKKLSGKEFLAYYLVNLQGVLYLQTLVFDKDFSVKESRLLNLAVNLEDFKPISIQRYEDKLYILARSRQDFIKNPYHRFYKQTLFQVDMNAKAGAESGRLDLTDANQMITDYHCFWDLNKGNLHLVGGLTDNNPMYTNRLFHQTVDLEKFSIQQMEVYPFKPNDIRSLPTDLGLGRTDNDFSGFRINHVLHKDDGSLDMVFDSFLWSIGTSRPYVSRGVNVAHFSPNGKMEYLTYVARNAGGSTSMGVNEFFSGYYDGKLRVVYVGGAKDMDEPALGGMNFVRRPHYYTASIDDKGIAKQEDLGPVSDRKDLLEATGVLEYTVRISPSEILWYVYKSKKMQYGRLLLK